MIPSIDGAPAAAARLVLKQVARRFPGVSPGAPLARPYSELGRRARFPLQALTMLLLLCASLMAQSTQPLRLKGISLGESHDRVSVALRRAAALQKEEEGQQVWKLRDDSELSYVLVGFDSDRHVRYVTLLAKPKVGLRCGPVGDIAAAQRTGSSGNFTYTRTLHLADGAQAAIAKGADAKHLSSCSIKKIGVQSEDKD